MNRFLQQEFYYYSYNTFINNPICYFGTFSDIFSFNNTYRILIYGNYSLFLLFLQFFGELQKNT